MADIAPVTNYVKRPVLPEIGSKPKVKRRPPPPAAMMAKLATPQLSRIPALMGMIKNSIGGSIAGGKPK